MNLSDAIRELKHETDQARSEEAAELAKISAEAQDEQAKHAEPELSEDPKPPANPNGYVDLRLRQKAKNSFYCPRCGERVEKGEEIAIMQAPGKQMRTHCHVECVNIARGAGNGKINPDQVREIAQDLDDKLSREVQAHIDHLHGQLAELRKSRNGKVDITIKLPERDTELKDEVLHPAFEQVLDLVADGEEVMLVGPTGSGKSHLGEQIARALDRPFRAQSCSGGVSESKFFGRREPVGDQGQFEFISTPFLEMYEHGGVFLLDEFDGVDPNVGVALNSALANGFVNVPGRRESPMAKRHPDFVAIAAMNTFGKGADRMYVGREHLDEATLDRFRMGVIQVEYSRDLETKLCPCSRTRNRLWNYRDKVSENRLERSVSTRFLAKAYRAIARCKATGRLYGYSSIDQLIDAKLMSGWRQDEIVKVRGRDIERP